MQRDGREVRLHPKEAQVLLELVGAAPGLVTREQLLARVWAGVVVGENVLDQVISSLRRALGDNARKPGCIETLSKRGYRLMVPVAPVTAREYVRETSSHEVPVPSRLAEIARRSFVGRAEELARIHAALVETKRGERRLVLIAGEPGIGKTRLTAEVAREAHASGSTVLAGRCDEDLGSPFQPWAQAMGHFAQHAAPEDLRALLDEDTLPIGRLIPELRRRLPDLPQIPPVEPESERWRLSEAIDLFLAAASRARPLVVILDDLHWADASSLSLLGHVARSARPAALLLVGTYRETELARTHPLAALLADLRREPHVERLTLRGLDEAELARLVEERLRHEGPKSFVRMLRSETEGNPFFAEEVLNHLLEIGALHPTSGAIPPDRPLSELGVPQGVREVVGRRLSRLSESANQVLSVAAVVGRAFEATVVEAASGIGRDVLLDALDEASGARIVAPVRDAAGSFAFAHALIQQTLYEELGSAERMRLHWRVGEALERRHPRDVDAHATAIAHHFAEGVLAGDPLRAADASLRAGERAAALAGHEDAKAHFERALATLDQAGLDEPESRYRAYMGIGEALRYLGEMSAHREPFLRAFRIAQHEGWAQRMAQATMAATQYLPVDAATSQRLRGPVEAALEALGPADGFERAVLLGYRAWIAHYIDADFDAMERGFEEAGAVADQCGDPDASLRVRHPAIMLLNGSPAIDEYERRSKQYLDRALARYGAPATAFAAISYVCAALARGDRAELELRMEEFRERAERAGARQGARLLGGWRVALALAEGRFGEAGGLIAEAQAGARDPQSSLAVLAQGLALRIEQGKLAPSADALAGFLSTAPRFAQYVRTVRAGLLASLGRNDEAWRELEAFDALALQPRGLSWPQDLSWLAECAALLGDEKRAAALERMLEPYAGQLFASHYGHILPGSADRARGQVAAALGRIDDAVACYESGLLLEESFGAAALAARTRYWLAAALVSRGAEADSRRAAAEASAARDAARALGMPHLAAQAESLADRLR